MNTMSDKLEKKFNKIIVILAKTQTPVMPSPPTRKVARGTNKSPVKHATSEKGPVAAFGELSHRQHHHQGKPMQKLGQHV
jgi:hypothetical protein